MTKAEKQRQNRQYYFARGLCGQCGGKNPVIPGYVRCAECQMKHDAYAQRNREKWRDEGRCMRCGGERVPGYKKCQKCLDYMHSRKRENADRCKERREGLIERGMCVDCGKRAALAGRVRCKICLVKNNSHDKKYDPTGEKKRARREALKAAGLCYDCSAPTDGTHTRCQKCMDARRDSTRKYKIMQSIRREADEARKGARKIVIF